MANILIIEDDRAVAQALAARLKNGGHACAVAPGGKGLVEHIRQRPPHLLVLDVMLPGISGFEVCRSIRRDPDLYMLPILMISAMDSPEEIEHGLAQGADDYLTKPIDLEAFAQRTEALLRASQNIPFEDALTSLADAEGTRRELQRRITRRDAFGLVYVELLNLRKFTRVAGAEGREKATRHLARCLDQCGKGLSTNDFFVGHMGVGHFVCIVPIDKAQTYCERAQNAWNQHLASFYESANQSAAFKAAQTNGDGELLSLLFCLTTRGPDDVVTPKQLLDIVARIRTNAAKEAPGVHVDRRS